ncbi:MAG: hypothetical protein Tsb009_31200 [Planctomycetaceae bacterium]
MTQKTILNIDDSATIRRLVDTTLSQAGYRVIVAENAEIGIQLAEEIRPDLILLDHQLPGTTGAEICRQLIDSPTLCTIPVVVSSTLRKKAYVEYTDMSNVVDMLPKPYNEELLTTTVANALETGKLIVESQSQGTAVPEVIHQQQDSDLSGTFSTFGLREVLDFLNNGSQHGTLEVDAGKERIWVALENGRIQAVVATGIDPKEVAAALPESLKELAPVLKFTVGGRTSSEADGIVELLNNKVLDPRLLRTLLRFQAAYLIHRCFSQELKRFRFESGRSAPALFQKLPLDISLMALLVEGALHIEESELADVGENTVFVRKAIRGQNLDRAGLSARHMKIVGALSEQISLPELTNRLGWDQLELRRVLHGLMMAEIVESKTQSSAKKVAVWETGSVNSAPFRELFQSDSDRFQGKLIRDRLGVQLLLKRSTPNVLVVPWDTEENRNFVRELQKTLGEKAEGVKWIGVLPEGNSGDQASDDAQNGFTPDGLVTAPYSRDDLVLALTDVFSPKNTESFANDSNEPESQKHEETEESLVATSTSDDSMG